MLVKTEAGCGHSTDGRLTAAGSRSAAISMTQRGRAEVENVTPKSEARLHFVYLFV